MIRKVGTSVTVVLNISDRTMMLKMTAWPGNRCLASAYAHSDERITWPKVPSTETNSVLNKYRENGTQLSPSTPNSSLKLRRVGFSTKKRGGKYQSSLSGLRALDTE